MVEPVPNRVGLFDWMLAMRERQPLMSDGFARWLANVRNGVNRATPLIGTVSLSAQIATVAATAIPTPTLTTGRYKITAYLRITRAATTNSSITLTIAWTDGGVACSQAFAAVTGNTTGTIQTNTMLVLADTATTITYTLTYASTGATSMQYLAEIALESVPSVVAS